MMSLVRERCVVTCCIAAGTIWCAAPALPQQYPVKPIRIVVAYSPGGGTDVLARVLGRKLTESEITRIVSLPDVKEQMRGLGADSLTSTPQRFLEFIREETTPYGKIIREAGIKVE
jgi:tripartite-type tricarboxylate transporter receptor subunit TctC